MAAAWLRVLISENLIPKGEVDERDIQDVRAVELAGYTQCHFFAGIGGWSLALRLAGWPDEKPVWTGSCPCQPFSSAGKGKGHGDERNLWPDFMRLIRERRPHVVFGEQVASAIGFGWLDGISADLEAEAYAIGSAVLGAHSVGAPHKRQRLYWVAIADDSQRRSDMAGGNLVKGNEAGWEQGNCESGTGGEIDSMGEPDGTGRNAGQSPSETAGHGSSVEPAGGSNGVALEYSYSSQKERFRQHSNEVLCDEKTNWHRESGSWSGFRIIQTRDGKQRRIPIEPAFFPLVDGFPARVALLKGFGNAIVPQVAAEFIKACLEVI